MGHLVARSLLPVALLTWLSPAFAQQSASTPEVKPFSSTSRYLSQAGYRRLVLRDLAPAGTLRVALQFLNPVLGTKNLTTGEIAGVMADLGRELAARLGVAFAPVEYPTPAAIVDSLKAGGWDVTFLAPDPSRTAIMDFTASYLDWDNTVVVRTTSPVRSVAEVDRPGIRIAVPGGASIEQVVARLMHQAQIVRVANGAAGPAAVNSGQVEAYAGGRPAILTLVDRFPGLLVLSDRLTIEQNAIAVPKGHAAGLAYVKEFVEWAKASGLVQRAVQRAGIRGAQIPPPAAGR